MSEIRRRGIQMIVPENHDIPKLWGFAWFEDRNSKSICYPIPLNMVASLLRDLWLWATFSPARLDSLARRYHAGYKAGYEAGRRSIAGIRRQAKQFVTSETEEHR